jgi:hypothetical protein
MRNSRAIAADEPGRNLSSEARNTTAFAISSDVPNLPRGTMLLTMAVEVSSSRNPGVSIKPGLIAFTRMRRCLRSVVHEIAATETPYEPPSAPTALF